MLWGVGMHSANADTRTAILYHDDFLLHDTGLQHPENPQRLSLVVKQLKTSPDLRKRLAWPSFKAADKATLALAHTPQYLDLVQRESQAVARGGYANLSTGDTVISQHSERVARLAVGASLAGAEAVMQNRAKSAFALVRPPGHHATASRGMGFCIYNSVAITARYLQQHYGLKRILIVDFDVHHGNGTQDIFYEDGSVFYFSAHQSPLYPGTGRPSETGAGLGQNTTMNIDVPRGENGSMAINAIKQKLAPAMQQFKPEFIIVSAGFDAHEGDTLGGLAYTNEDYASLAKEIQALADAYTQGKTLYVLEGGYVPKNIAEATMEILNVVNK